MESSNKSLTLGWEKNFSGETAFLMPIKRIITPVLSKKIAISKMIDINLISGEFGQSPISFSPLLGLLMDASSSIIFFGVYMSDALELRLDSDLTTRNNENNNSPAICVRKATWNKNRDLENLKLADDKIQYLLSDSHMSCNVLFLDVNQGKTILNSIIQIVKTWKNGLTFESHTPKEIEYEQIRIAISAESFDLNFSYNPYLINSAIWEDLRVNLCKNIDELPVDIGYSPDKKIRVSYQLSLLEQIGISIMP